MGYREFRFHLPKCWLSLCSAKKGNTKRLDHGSQKKQKDGTKSLLKYCWFMHIHLVAVNLKQPTVKTLRHMFKYDTF